MPTTSVADRVADALVSDPRTSHEVVDVVYKQGVVTLAGKVKSQQARLAAEEIARSQDGVISVVNELKVG
jgi:osmotically-inducible protein OsmY